LTGLERLRRASLDVAQTIEDARGVELCTARNAIACVDSATFKPRRLPPHMSRVLEGAH
jgi:acyl-CoA thioesterase FadM